MKIWLKYFFGALLGVISFFIIPTSSPQFISGLRFCTEIVTRLGCYILCPLIFSAAIVSSFKLANEKRFFKAVFKIFLTIIVTGILLTLIGLLTVMIVRLPRIPITDEKMPPLSFDIQGVIRRIFPFSSFAVLLEENFFFPCFLLAIFIGIGSTFDSKAAKFVIQAADSFSVICYKIMTFFIDVLSIGLTALSINWMIEYHSIIISGVFTPLIIMFACLFFLLAVCIYPALWCFVLHNHHPYRVLRAAVAPAIIAFFSGNTNLALPAIIKECKENLGIHRHTSGTAIPLFAIFSHGGSALVTTMCFAVIWHSYSITRLSFVEIGSICRTALALSFLLGFLPSDGTFFSLATLCALCGKGFEAGHLLLKPAAIIIGSFAAAIDAVTTVFGTYFIATKTDTDSRH